MVHLKNCIFLRTPVISVVSAAKFNFIWYPETGIRLIFFQEDLINSLDHKRTMCASPKVEMAQNWKRLRTFHFWVSPKLEMASVSTFGKPKLETQLPDPKVETSITVW